MRSARIPPPVARRRGGLAWTVASGTGRTRWPGPASGGKRRGWPARRRGSGCASRAVLAVVPTGRSQVRCVGDLADDQRGRILAEASIQGERHLDAVGDRPLVGAGFPRPGRQPRIVHLVGELAQPGTAERRFAGLRRQERGNPIHRQEITQRWGRQLPAVPAVHRVILEPGRGELPPHQRPVTGVLDRILAHVREHRGRPVRSWGADTDHDRRLALALDR